MKEHSTELRREQSILAEYKAERDEFENDAINARTELAAMKALNQELVEALRKCTNLYWEALGGADDDDNKERADICCKQFYSLLAKAK